MTIFPGLKLILFDSSADVITEPTYGGMGSEKESTTVSILLNFVTSNMDWNIVKSSVISAIRLDLLYPPGSKRKGIGFRTYKYSLIVCRARYQIHVGYSDCHDLRGHGRGDRNSCPDSIKALSGIFEIESFFQKAFIFEPGQCITYRPGWKITFPDYFFLGQ